MNTCVDGYTHSSLKVQRVIYGEFEKETGTLSGYILNCNVFYPSDLVSELRWLD